MAQCEKCGKDFSSDHALKVHVGIAHGVKKGKGGRPRKVHAPAAGGLTCPDCGRSFAMSMHLARHRAASHGVRAVKPGKRGKVGRPPGKVGRPPGKVGRPVGKPAKAGLAVQLVSLSIDQLLSLRDAVQVRLADIARQIRKANIR